MAKRIQWGTSGVFIKEYLWHIIIYTIAVCVIAAVSYLIARSRIWYPEMPIYPIVHWIHVHWLSALLSVFLIGYVVISCLHFCIIASMLGKVADAVDMLYPERAGTVSLPGQLHEMERKMNQVMQDLQRSRQAAREAEQRKNDLIVYMAHDLKTPLTSVIGYLTLLSDEKEITKATREKYLGITLRKAERLEELINEFFDITRFNLSHITLDMSEVNLSRMLEQILFEFRPLFAEKRLTYELEAEPDILLSCDVDKMERVLDNLLKNAVNYSYEDTEIRVKLQRDSREGVSLEVLNRGKTIPKEKLERVFEQFFRLDSSRGSKTGGSGLGLAIAREIVELHGGTVTCESENEQITFKVVLPIMS